MKGGKGELKGVEKPTRTIPDKIIMVCEINIPHMEEVLETVEDILLHIVLC